MTPKPRPTLGSKQKRRKLTGAVAAAYGEVRRDPTLCALCGHKPVKVGKDGLASCPACGVTGFIPGEGICYVEAAHQLMHISHAVARLKEGA